MIFEAICSGIVLPGISKELVGIEIPMTSKGDINSGVSVLLIFGFSSTEVVFVWGWKTLLVFCCDF